MEKENNNYKKRPLWQWILIYVLIAIVVYGLIYYLFIAKTGSYFGNNTGGTENNSTPAGNVLDLSKQGLKNIPSYVFNETNLEELDVSNNNLTGAIPAEIRHLVNLKILNASNNSMTGVPAEIGQLQKLEVLDLSNNKLTGLPQELGNLKNLKILDLSGNQYSKQDLDYIRSKLPSTTSIVTD